MLDCTGKQSCKRSSCSCPIVEQNLKYEFGSFPYRMVPKQKQNVQTPKTHKYNSRMTWTGIYFHSKNVDIYRKKRCNHSLSKCFFLHFLHLCPDHPDVPTNCFFSAFRDYRITSGGPALYLGMTSDIWIFTTTDPPSAFSSNNLQYF